MRGVVDVLGEFCAVIWEVLIEFCRFSFPIYRAIQDINEFNERLEELVVIDGIEYFICAIVGVELSSI